MGFQCNPLGPDFYFWVSQKFCNIFVTWNTTLDAFAKVMKVMNHPGLCQHRLILSKYYELDLSLSLVAWSMASESKVSGLLDLARSIKVLATWAKFLEPSAYCTVIYYALIFCKTNVFRCFYRIKAKFELVKHKFLK